MGTAEGVKVGSLEGGEGQQPKGSFTDPVVRCTECQRLVLREEIQAAGGCPDCGCRRVRNVLTLKDEEMATVREKWPSFAALFEGKPGVAA